MLIAAFYTTHENHPPSFEALRCLDKRSACQGRIAWRRFIPPSPGCSVKERVGGDEALLFLGSIRERLTTVTLEPDEYFKAIDGAAAECQAFQTLGPNVANRVKTP